MNLSAISTLSKFNPGLNFQQKTYFKNNQAADTVEFRHKDISFGSKQKEVVLSLADFSRKLLDSKQTIDSVVHTNVKPQNFLGEGLNSRVYAINGIQDYVIKVFKNVGSIEDLVFKEIKPVKDKLEGKNLGQVIGEISDGVFLLKKQIGKEHSINNWSAVITKQAQITTNQAQKFANDIKKLAKMPKSTYEDMASTINYLSQKGYKADSINPNNLLIDYDKNIIHVIDSFEACNDAHKNSCYDMISPLLDFSLFDDYSKLLKGKQKKEFIKDCQTITKKCFTAAKKTNLSTSEKTYINYLTEVDKWFGCKLPDKDYRARYLDLKNQIGLNS